MKIVHVVGARPNFMKVAPTIEALRAYASVEQSLVHTGQHYDYELSQAFFEDLELPRPDFFLGAGSGSHGVQTAAILVALEPVLAEAEPDVVLVAGDANSTMAAALAAVKLGFPVAHLEAGLRCYDRTMPEEHNRVIADHVGDLLLTPTRDADMNLIREGIDPSRIAFVGNTMIDSLRRYQSRAAELDVATKELGVSEYILVTLHRPALVDDPVALVEVMDSLEEIARERPVVFPIHPRTLQVLKATDWHASSVLLLEPQSYLRFLSLELGAWAVLTDSGGIQEETTILGIPCFTLRRTTERPLTVSEGTNRVLGIGRDALAAFRAALGEPLRREPASPEGWDGRAAERAAVALLRRYGTERAETPALALG